MYATDPTAPPLNTEIEIRRLLDLMPATGRMLTKILSKPGQSSVIDAALPKPWASTRPIAINFDLWSQLTQPEQDLLLLRTTCWVTGVKWLRPSWMQGAVAVGALGTGIELLQSDPVGILIAGGLTALAANQIWRKNYSARTELEADEAALRVAQRRGYDEAGAARALLMAIEHVAQIEGRTTLSFTELVRSQNLRMLSGLSPVSVPETARQD